MRLRDWICVGLCGAGSWLTAQVLPAAEKSPLTASPIAAAKMPVPAAEEFFEKEVRPLLVKRCYECHAGAKSMGGLRLTSRAEILKGGASGPAAVPGKPRDSLLVEAIEHAGGMEMPPKGKIPDREIATLSRWIEWGLPWPGERAPAVAPVASTGNPDEGFLITATHRQHWAYLPVPSPVLPAVKNTAWPAGAIDRYVLAELERRNLSPNSRADKRTLLRRVTLDLTGLPPTRNEIHEFLADQSPAAWENVIDRLLSSEQYGERWGRLWLDVVRYADTAGDGADYPIREAWKYRNWVIDAFNHDLPYDQFLREQVAGDLLAKSGPPEKYAASVIATGFLAATRRYGYNTNDDFRHLDISDTIDVLGKVVLGLSLGCARCHHHKYDPVSMGDYYGLYGIFDSSQYSFPGGEEHKRPEFLVPLVPPATSARLEQQWKQDLAKAKEKIGAHKEAWFKILSETQSVGGRDLAFEAQRLDAPLSELFPSNGASRIQASAQSPYRNVYPAGTRGLHLPRSEQREHLVRQTVEPAWDARQFLYVNLDFRLDRENLQAAQPGSLHIYLGHDTRKSPLLEVAVAENQFFAWDGDQYTAVGPVACGTWQNLQLAIDFKSRRYTGTVSSPEGVLSIASRKFNRDWDGTVDTLRLDGIAHLPGPRAACDLDNLAVAGTEFPRFDSTSGDRAADKLEGAAIAERNESIRRRAEAEEAALEAARRRYYLLEETPPYPVAYAMTELKGHNVRVQLRGEPTKPGAEAPRRFLEILGGDQLPPAYPGSGRLQLAEWLTRASNPLTARVLVNRVWQGHFGRGLVPTASDFGLRGEPPTNLPLLNYLAQQFVKQGWSLKKLHREMLLSQTYQLSSADRPENLARDPENLWLWKYRRHRLDAEEIRDGILALAGTLDKSRGEGFPFPPVKNWNFTIHNQFRMTHASNRRSVYLLAMRLTRDPYLSLFDGADPGATVERRPETTTPTQALYLMNSPFIHEQSQTLARRVRETFSRDEERIPYVVELVQGVDPEAEAIAAARGFLSQYRALAAEAGVAEPDRDLAAWSAYCRALLTSNGFLYVE